MKFEAMPQGAPQAKVETKEKPQATPESVQALLRSRFKNPMELFSYIKEASDRRHASDITGNPTEDALTHTLHKLRGIRERYYRGEVFNSYRGDDLESITRVWGAKPISLKDVNDAYRLGAELMATCSAVYYGEATYVDRDTGELLDRPIQF